MEEEKDYSEEFGAGGEDESGLPDFGGDEGFGTSSGDSDAVDFGSTDGDFGSDVGFGDVSDGGQATSGSVFDEDVESGGGGYGYDDGDQDSSDEEGGDSKKFIYIIVGFCVLATAGGLAWLKFRNPDDQKKADVENPLAEGAILPPGVSITEIGADATSDTSALATEKKAGDPSTDTTVGTVKAPAEKLQQVAPVAKVSSRVTANTASTASVGGTTTLKAPTGRAYIVVASFSSRKKAKAFSRRLSRKGHSPVIIPPLRSAPYYRISVANFPSFASARRKIVNYKGEFGPDVWVLTYR